MKYTIKISEVTCNMSKMQRLIENGTKLATSTYKTLHTGHPPYTLLTFSSIINPQCPCALLPVSYLQFHGITYPLVLVLFVFLHRKFDFP